MGTLAALGLETAGPLMLIAPPDSVLAEAGRLKPRPAVASSIMTAEPTARIAWWPDLRTLAPATLGRLRWMIEAAGAEAWLVLDHSEGLPSAEEAIALAGAAGLSALETRIVGPDETVLRLIARPLEKN